MKKLLFSLFVLFSSTTYADPTFTPLKPLRNVGDLGPVVTDVESHLPAGHPYQDADRITWTHEGTHGVNSRIRGECSSPGFYVLKDRAVLLKEPATTLSIVAQTVPASLRGDVYNLYLIQGQNWWNNQPSYVFDEWTAYTNGTEARLMRGIQDRAETCRYAQEFIVYAICVARASDSTDPQMREFIRWQIECVLTLAKDSKLPINNGLRDAQDAEALRMYARQYLGAEWCKRILGF